MDDTLDKLAIGVLLYGEHALLAARCLESIRRVFPKEFCRERLIVAANAPGKPTRLYVENLIEKGWLAPERYLLSEENSYKYPVLRKVRDLAQGQYLVWFDDDSYLTDEAAIGEWPCNLVGKMANFVMVGQRWYWPWAGKQREWVMGQPWYTGKPFPGKFPFLTGGWWCLSLEVMRRFDYPFAALKHRGGDTMWGALLHQQGLPFLHWHQGVVVNSSPRRGYNETPLGVSGSTATAGPNKSGPIA